MAFNYNAQKSMTTISASAPWRRESEPLTPCAPSPWRREDESLTCETPEYVAPWRRGLEYTQIKTLSVEAPEFVPSWKEEPFVEANYAVPSVPLISLGAYSDESDDEPLSKTISAPLEAGVNAASGKHSSPFRFRRPWRVTAAEFVPRGMESTTATPTAALRRQDDVYEMCVDESSCPKASSSKAPPWRRTSTRAINADEKPRLPLSASSETKSSRSTSPGQDSGSDNMIGSAVSISTFSTSASTPVANSHWEPSPSVGSFSVGSGASCSRSATPPPVEQPADVWPLTAVAIVRCRHAINCDERPDSVLTSAEEIEQGNGELVSLEASAPAPSIFPPLQKEGGGLVSLQALLRWRHASPSKRPEGTFCSAAASEPGTPEATSAQAAADATGLPTPTKVSSSGRNATANVTNVIAEEKCWRNVKRVEKLRVSDDSWAARQRARRGSHISELEATSNEEVVRTMKAILNKLTVEKFEALSGQLIQCDIRNTVHLELLIQEVFEKATTQHHFIDMYADLCTLLNAHYADHPIIDDPKMSFKKVLLNCCQASFEKNLAPPQGLESLDSADRTVEEQLYKTRMLGNIRFVGALLVRKMLASKVMLAIMEELLQDPTSEALESLAALLTVVGPTFDHPDWAHRKTLNAIFAQVEKLTKKSSVSSRVRCLLKDVLDLRNADWRCFRPKKIEGPKKLEEVAANAAMENNSGGVANKSSSLGAGWEVVNGPRNAKLGAARFPTSDLVGAGKLKSSPVSAEKPAKTTKNTGAGQAMLEFLNKRERVESNDDSSKSKKESPSFDRDACKNELSSALSELRVSYDVNEAIARIEAIAVPKQDQPTELVGLLSSFMEEGSEATRKVCFGLLVGLFVEGHWKPKALYKGLQLFIEETCPDLKYDVPNLERIVRDELCPLLAPLVDAKVLGADQHKALIAGF